MEYDLEEWLIKKETNLPYIIRFSWLCSLMMHQSKSSRCEVGFQTKEIRLNQSGKVFAFLLN